MTMLFVQPKNYLSHTSKVTASTVTRVFSSVPVELFVLFTLLAPVFLFLGVGLLHSGLFVLIRGTSFVVGMGLPLGGLLLATGVVLFRNTIHSLLALIGVFVCFVTIYLTQGIEYLAYVFLIVYVGAVAILFLFVIMLLNVKALSRNSGLVKHTTQILGIFSGALLFWRLFTTLRTDSSMLVLTARGLISSEATSFEGFIHTVNNAADIAAFSALFGTESALFLVILMILLVAMLGAIILATKSMEVENAPTDQMEIVGGASRLALPYEFPPYYLHTRCINELTH